MKLVVIALDASIANKDASAAKRQVAYYDGWDVDIVILAAGSRQTVQLSPSVRVHVSGGATKISALWNGYRLAMQIVRQQHADVITAQDPLWCGMVASRVARKYHIGFHLQDHSAMFARQPVGRVEKLLAGSARHLAQQALRTRTVSLRGKRGLLTIGIPEDRIDVIPIATDTTRLVRIPDVTTFERNVLCIARLEMEKGVDLLIEAWSDVVRTFPDARLRIVGDGSQRKVLEARVAALSLMDSIEFRGAGSDIVPELSWASVYVQPSRYEGWGMAVIEAVAAGRTVVMTDVGCAGEVIVNNETGIVVPMNSPEGIAQGIRAVFADPVHAKQFAQSARAAIASLQSPTQAVEKIRESLASSIFHPRLLIVCQAVDEQDALFGFFVRWIREASSVFSRVSVLALRVGNFQLPSSVNVVPLRPASSRSRFTVIWTLWRESWKQRRDYDAVYIRGDYQYPILAGWLWWLLGKRVILFYAHYTARPFLLRLAAFNASAVVTSVRSACPISSCIPIGQAIDAPHFSQQHVHATGAVRILSYGRISDVKRVDWIVRECQKASPDLAKQVTMFGKPTTPHAAEDLRRACADTGATWNEQDVSYDDAPSLYASYDVFVNATPGSLDKTIIEACLSNLLVIASASGYGEMLPDDLKWLNPSDAQFGATVLRAAAMAAPERDEIAGRVREIALKMHSQTQQIEKVARLARF